MDKISFIKCIYATFIDFFAFTTHISIGRNHLIKNGSTDFVLLVVSCDHISGRPKQVNTETTETEISVKFTEPKPKLPKRN